MEATDSGRARPHSSSQEQEGQEPHGLCFDLEEPLTSRKQCVGAQPVGREECKVCCALLISESQELACYQSKKHANKVKRCLAIHGMETLKGEMKKLDSGQNSRSKDKNQCCPFCNMTCSSPVVAPSQLSKTHTKNLELQQQSTKVEALSKCFANPFPGASTLALYQDREMIGPVKFCSLGHATYNDPETGNQLKFTAHYGRLADPAIADASIMLNSIERYQAHVTMASHLGQIPMQRQAGH
ncbi:unnamed protein product [Nyctereutes procyonoides]|uniref:(raccoon dog) hypothetical protein n=1 Tax=Nyctereutes procyonoides TaxID=34880 RepID=A0A811ZFB6_NYCPR|nr:unnamed protein product [Nyctereutes procyonoides]